MVLFDSDAPCGLNVNALGDRQQIHEPAACEAHGIAHWMARSAVVTACAFNFLAATVFAAASFLVRLFFADLTVLGAPGRVDRNGLPPRTAFFFFLDGDALDGAAPVRVIP